MSRTGRPKIANAITSAITIKVDAETKKALEDYCTKNSVSKGEVVRQGIKMVIEEKKK